MGRKALGPLVVQGCRADDSRLPKPVEVLITRRQPRLVKPPECSLVLMGCFVANVTAKQGRQDPIKKQDKLFDVSRSGLGLVRTDNAFWRIRRTRR